MNSLPPWADWYPHFAVLAYFDGRMIICKCHFIIFRRAFAFGRPALIHNIHKVQFMDFEQPRGPLQ